PFKPFPYIAQLSKAFLQHVPRDLLTVARIGRQLPEWDLRKSDPPHPYQKKGEPGWQAGISNTKPFWLKHKDEANDLENDTSNVTVRKALGTHPILLIDRGNLRKVGIVKQHATYIPHRRKRETSDPPL